MEDSTMTDVDIDMASVPVHAPVPAPIHTATTTTPGPVHAEPSSTPTLRRAKAVDPNKEAAMVLKYRGRAGRKKERRARIAEARLWVEQRREEKRVAGLLEGFGLAGGDGVEGEGRDQGKGKGKEREEGAVEDDEDWDMAPGGEKAVSSADGFGLGKKATEPDPLHTESLNEYIHLHAPPPTFVSSLKRSFLAAKEPSTKESRQERARALQLQAQTAAAARRGQTLDDYLACREHAKERRKQALAKREKARADREARGGGGEAREEGEGEEWRLAPGERFSVPGFGAGLPGLGEVEFGAGMGGSEGGGGGGGGL